METSSEHMDKEKWEIKNELLRMTNARMGIESEIMEVPRTTELKDSDENGFDGQLGSPKAKEYHHEWRYVNSNEKKQNVVTCVIVYLAPWKEI